MSGGWHFMVPQQLGERKQFEDDGRTFEVIPFSGHNFRAGMGGNTNGLVLNQVAPVKRTVLFTRRYYSDGAGGSGMCEVSSSFFEGIEDFLKRHEVEWWGKPDTMKKEADGHYFTPAKWSSDFIKLHPEDPEYDEKEDPDVEKKK